MKIKYNPSLTMSLCKIRGDIKTYLPKGHIICYSGNYTSLEFQSCMVKDCNEINLHWQKKTGKNNEIILNNLNQDSLMLPIAMDFFWLE